MEKIIFQLLSFLYLYDSGISVPVCIRKQSQSTDFWRVALIYRSVGLPTSGACVDILCRRSTDFWRRKFCTKSVDRLLASKVLRFSRQNVIFWSVCADTCKIEFFWERWSKHKLLLILSLHTPHMLQFYHPIKSYKRFHTLRRPVKWLRTSTSSPKMPFLTTSLTFYLKVVNRHLPSNWHRNRNFYMILKWNDNITQTQPPTIPRSMPREKPPAR